jgi:hypothetical protein
MSDISTEDDTFDPEEATEFMLGLLRWFRQWGPVLIDIEEHPEKYPVYPATRPPRKPRRKKTSTN